MQQIIISNLFIIVFLTGTVVSFLINQLLEFLDWRAERKSGGKLPPELADIPAASCFNTEKLANISAYKSEKYKTFIPSSITGLAVTLCLVWFGFYPWLYQIICGWTGQPDGFANTYWCAFLFFVLAGIPESIVEIPFSLYSEFHVEKKFGFSNMTLKLWILDGIKSFLVSTIMSAILVAAMIGVLCAAPTTWWIFLTAVLILLTFVLQVIYPIVIAPLFNKFTPLEDGELKNRISSLMEKTGFKASGIFVMDASKRSGHSNAYFGGMGKSKRIVLFDTLIKQLTTDELEAVLGHELGHCKLHHILRRMFIMIPLEFVVMYVLYFIAQSPDLYSGFGFQIAKESISSAQFIGLFLASMIAGAVEEILSPIVNFGSRKDEYAADAYSAKLTEKPDALISGLIKLNSENLSQLLPPKLYVFWNYSHPTLIERIRSLKGSRK